MLLCSSSAARGRASTGPRVTLAAALRFSFQPRNKLCGNTAQRLVPAGQYVIRMPVGHRHLWERGDEFTPSQLLFNQFERAKRHTMTLRS